MSKNTIRTKSVDEIMKGIKGEIYSKDNLQEWYNEIYENATKVALKYKSLKQLIPPQSTLKPLIDKSYKYTGDYYKNLNDKYISKDAQVYISKIKDETIKKAIVPIHKKGDSSKYSKRSEKSINLQTLHSFLKIIKNTFRMYSDKYSCPLSLIKEFIIECENYYSFINSLKKDRNKKEKYENKVTALKKQKSELNKEKKNLIKDDPEYKNKKAEYDNEIKSINEKLDEIYDSIKIENIEILPCFSDNDKSQMKEFCSNHKGRITEQYASSYDNVMHKFLHEIRGEYPGFECEMIGEDLIKGYFVAPFKDNERMKLQNGLFYIFGLDERALDEKLYTERIVIDKNAKDDILDDLEKMNISNSHLYSGLERAAMNNQGRRSNWISKR